jgi:hypothetical protein
MRPNRPVTEQNLKLNIAAFVPDAHGANQALADARLFVERVRIWLNQAQLL